MGSCFRFEKVDTMLDERTKTESGWDYRTANTKEYTHGIHPYPAMMIPQVARRLIGEYGCEEGILFDPYCGSGTTLLEGMLADLVSTGTDLNPLARLIARTKTVPIDVEHLDREIGDFIEYGLLASESIDGRVNAPDIPNVDYWFSGRVQRDLCFVRSYIDGISRADIANFFRVAFSLTVRTVSWTKNSEFKLVRMPRELMRDHDPDVYATMTAVLNDNSRAFKSLDEALCDDPLIPSVFAFNSVTGIPSEIYGPDTVDIVVTSPPYGDSKTTVAYGQFSRLSSQWLGYENANQVDNMLMGGGKLAGDIRFGFSELDEVIGEICDVDAKRAGEVASFFVDYRRSISNVANVVKPGGFVCYVVGNRTVKGMEVPTAETTAAFFEMSGFQHVDTFHRNIPNKRMPSLNSPTNVPGKLGKTMKSEIIVVCRKTI